MPLELVEWEVVIKCTPIWPRGGCWLGLQFVPNEIEVRRQARMIRFVYCFAYPVQLAAQALYYQNRWISYGTEVHFVQLAYPLTLCCFNALLIFLMWAVS